ncbi:MAG: DUF1330 domain-containing protein [Calditrichaeota bacterium]|nr:MAG: DUF1330 domain-containing protein [Calditrichota bacterium]
MNTINPSKEKMAEFLKGRDNKRPIAVLNLLKLKESVEIENGKIISGTEAYKRYSLRATKLVWQCGGQILWMGKVNFSLIAPPEEKWDQVILIYYPSRAHFLQMINSPIYSELAPHRAAALETSRLLEIRQVKFSKLLLNVLAFFHRIKTRFSL